MLKWQEGGLLLTNIDHFVYEVCLYESITKRLCFIERCKDPTMNQLVLSHKSHLVGVQDLLGVKVDMRGNGRHL